jgi:hypothetical protein
LKVTKSPVTEAVPAKTAAIAIIASFKFISFSISIKSNAFGDNVLGLMALNAKTSEVL